MNTIRKGKFAGFIMRLLNKYMPFNLDGVEMQLPIRMNLDPE